METHRPDLASPGVWTPVRFFPGPDGAPLVEWCHLGDLRLTAPFFLQTVHTARARHLPNRTTAADALTALADRVPELPLAGLILHLSRCGSTLVTQSLAALPANVVVSEPEPVDAVLRSDVWCPAADARARAGWLRGLTRAWGTRRFQEERHLLLKLEPWHVLDLDVIRAAFPGVPLVFLYRDPVEILVSQSDNLAASLVTGCNGPGRLGLERAEAAPLTVDEHCARVLGMIARGAADAAARDPGIRLVAYPQLPAAVATIVAPWFGLTLDAADEERMRPVARFHAKAPGRLVFEEDSARKQRQAEPELRDLADRWMAPAYTRLEELRLAQERVATTPA